MCLFTVLIMIEMSLMQLKCDTLVENARYIGYFKMWLQAQKSTVCSIDLLWVGGMYFCPPQAIFFWDSELLWSHFLKLNDLKCLVVELVPQNYRRKPRGTYPASGDQGGTFRQARKPGVHISQVDPWFGLPNKPGVHKTRGSPCFQ